MSRRLRELEPALLVSSPHITQLREQLALDFRWELYNAFNTPTFANPASTYAANGPGNAGRITSTIGGPRTMQAAVRLQF